MEILDEMIFLDNTGVEKIIPIAEVQKELGGTSLEETKETILSLIQEGIFKKVGISKDGKSPVYSMYVDENKELIAHFERELQEEKEKESVCYIPNAFINRGMELSSTELSIVFYICDKNSSLSNLEHDISIEEFKKNLSLSRQEVRKNIRSLIKKKIIQKRDENINGLKVSLYKVCDEYKNIKDHSITTQIEEIEEIDENEEEIYFSRDAAIAITKHLCLKGELSEEKADKFIKECKL